MGGDDRKLVPVKLYLFDDQRRELKQRALNGDSNGSAVARDILDAAFATPATVATPVPTPLGSGHMGIPPGTTRGSRAAVDVRRPEETS